MIPWDETVPQPTSYLSELAEVWQSTKSSFDAAIRTHFYWSDSTSSAGEPRYSTSTPGSARAYYGLRSAVSDPKRIGSMMVVSDESRLLAFGSASSVVIGSKRAMVEMRSFTTAEVTNARWLVQSGSGNVSDGVANAIDFTTAYGAAPVVYITPSAQDGATSSGSYAMAVVPGGGDAKSGFSLAVTYIGPTASPNNGTVYWMSVGTVGL